MPAISTGRNPGSAAGRSAGHRKDQRVGAVGRGADIVKPAPKPAPVRRTPDQADRSRTPAQKRRDKQVSDRNIREATRKVVQRRSNEQRQLGLDARNKTPAAPVTRTLAGPRFELPSEAERRPKVDIRSIKTPSTTDAVKTIAKAIGKAAVGEKDTKYQGKQSALSTALGNAVPVLKAASFIPGTPRDVARNTGKDLYQFPAQVVPSMVQTASAINQARQLNFEPAKAILKDADEHDPVWNTVVAAGELFTGDTKSASKRIKAAAKSAKEHPGLTALEVFGAKGATGRLITRTAAGTRRAGSSRAAQAVAPKTATRVADRAGKIASTERAPQTLPGTNLVVHRQHTRDAFQRIADRKQDQQRRRKAQENRDAAAKVEKSDPVEAAKLRQSARRWDPDLITGHGIRRAVDEHVDASEQTRRAGLKRVIKAVRKETKGAKRGGPLVNLLAQGITKADVPELKAYRQRLIDEGAKLEPSETAKIQANRQLVDDLGKAISDVESGKVDLNRMKRIADAYTERSRASQQELIDRKLIDPHEAERAALTPHAVAQMDAGREPGTLKAFAVKAGKEAEKAKGKAKGAKSKRSRQSARQTQQRVVEPSAQIKRDVSTKLARPLDTARQRSRGAGGPSRGESVVAYIKRIEDQLEAEQPTFHVGGRSFTSRADADAYQKDLQENLPSREKAIRDRPKPASGTPDPDVDRLTANLKPGKAGFSIEDEHVVRRERGTNKPVGFGRALPGSKVVVYRDELGRPQGALGMQLDPDGQPGIVEIAVHEGARGKGLASELYRKAAQAGYDVERASGEGGLTEAGAALRHKRLTAAAVGKIQRRQKTGPRGGLTGEAKREAKRQADAEKAKARVKSTKETAAKAKAKASKARKRADENPLVLPGGKPLSTDAMRASAGRVPAFISQKPRGLGRSAYYVANEKAPAINTGRRSGRATAEGGFDASPDTLEAQEARTFSVVAAFDSFKRLVDRFGYREDGTLKQADTFKDADQIALDLSKRDGREWVPMRVNPLGASKEQLAEMMSGESPKSIAKTLSQAADEGDGGPWIVVPKSAASQMTRHMSKMDPGDIARLAQAGTTQFRRTVLSLSPTWFAGNTGEATLRSALSQVGPRSWLTGRAAVRDAPKLDIKDLTPKQVAARAELGTARTIGSGRTALVNRAQMHRDATQFEEGLLRDVGEKLHQIGEAEAKGVPLPPKAIGAAWSAWTHLSMDMINRTVENQFQTAMLGKAIRNQRSGSGQRVAAVRPKALMTKRARDLSEQAAKEQAEGLVSENTAAALGREVDRMYGRYSKMSPHMRSLVANYTPFIAWTMNAARFVARLPVDHPTFTALSATLERQSEEWRKDHGLDMFMGTGKAPLWLQGSVPDGKGGHYRAPTRYTPFSLGVDPGGTIAQQLLPQVNGPLMALRGLDWKGDKLKDKDGKEIEGAATWPAALAAFGDSMIPGLSLIKKIKKKGSVGSYLKDTLTQYTAPQKSTGRAAPDDGGFDFGAGASDAEFDWDAAGVSSSDFDW